MIRALLPLALLAGPAGARVVSAGDAMLIVQAESIVPVAPERVWSTLVAPSRWWSPAHTVSGDAANLQIGERAGGCFCETLPRGGAVEHLRVVRIEPGRLLRMAGALGPLQPQPLLGALTVTLTPEAGRTRVRFVYSLSGASSPPLPAMAPLVDAMLGEQVARLAAAAQRPVPPPPATAPVARPPVAAPPARKPADTPRG